MLSIGELAHRTGVSRRMLRHWEERGLLTPAAIEPRTGHRSYVLRQAGRVRAIAALRSIGYSLEAIDDLLSAHLSEPRLVELLRQRESELVTEISVASTRLDEVRSRLASIKKGHETIMNELALAPLPALNLAGVSEDVTDETEIAGAVSRLLAQLDPAARSGDVMLTYDGSDDSVITVWAGVESAAAAVLSLPASATAVSVTHPAGVANVGDAWLAIDADLEKRMLRTTGPYRQTLHADGRVTLAAPVTVSS